MGNIISFIVGLMVGAPIGFFVAALCVAAKRSEKQDERIIKEMEKINGNSDSMR